MIAGESAASVVGGGHGAALAYGGGLIFAAYVLNFVGLRVSAGAQFATLAIIALGLAVIVAFALPSVEASAFRPFFSKGYPSVGLAASQLFWAFVGWEAITPLAREFKNPREIWRASLVAVVVVGVLYLSLAVAVVGTRAAVDPSQSAPLVQLAARVFGAQASRVVGVAGFLLCFIPVNAYIAGTSRLVFALGERGQLPRWLGHLSAGGTPRRAVVALGLAAGVALVGTALAQGDIAGLLPVSTASFLATYVLSMAAAVKLLRPPMSYAAFGSLLACVAVLPFVGTALLWIAGVAVACLAYQRLSLAGRRRVVASPQ
jgi:amino acid efflux transporter